ncbi:MAG: aspartate aminotransferase family protein [Alphaproteobacteria bacterium]|jgi:aromatic-L-amino-acid/L-tryptophan decarboxylase|nr:aspartate aminotransferase family protein [Alphaproteobacteria bacterium]
MEIEEFRAHAHELVDWMADYMTGVEALPVRAQVKPGEITAKLPLGPPTAPEPMDAIMADFKQDILPGMTHWQHPRFFAYFPANSSPPSVLAEMLTATLGAQGMLWQTSPAATEMETRVTDWLRQMIGLPEGFHGVIQDSASSAILCAILTARERATGWQANEAGLAAGPEIVVYTSDQTHSATEKGAKIAGLGRQNVRLIKTDPETFAMDPAAFEAAVLSDKAAGRIPACLVANLGATGVGAMDDLAALGAIAKRHNIFAHVDAAWAGAALILDEYRHLMAGIEYFDSFVFNPHKWLLTNFDCSAHFVRDPDDLVRTLAILPVFLKSREHGAVIDYRDWSVPLGRRFRALKLWFVIRSYGVEGLQRILRNHIQMAAELEARIAASTEFSLMAPRVLSLINFRYAPDGIAAPEALDALNERLLNAVNDDGFTYLTQNRVHGRYVIRFQIGHTSTAQKHVTEAWERIEAIAATL